MAEEVKEETTEVKSEAVTPSTTPEEFTPPSTDDLFGEASNSPEVEEVAAESKETETEETEVKTEEEVKTDSETTSTDKESEETSKDDKTGIDYDSDDNPYKSAALNFEKRFKDTQRDREKMLGTLREHGLADEAPEVSEADQKADDAFLEREKASKSTAIEIYGAEFVQKNIYADDAPFRKILESDSNYLRMKSADAPVMELIKMNKEADFFGKYGTDTSKISDKIREELKTELREEITKELQGKLSKKEKIPKTLAGVNSEDVGADKGNGDFVAPSTEDLFG